MTIDKYQTVVPYDIGLPTDVLSVIVLWLDDDAFRLADAVFLPLKPCHEEKLHHAIASSIVHGDGLLNEHLWASRRASDKTIRKCMDICSSASRSKLGSYILSVAMRDGRLDTVSLQEISRIIRNGYGRQLQISFRQYEMKLSPSRRLEATIIHLIKDGSFGILSEAIGTRPHGGIDEWLLFIRIIRDGTEAALGTYLDEEDRRRYTMRSITRGFLHAVESKSRYKVEALGLAFSGVISRKGGPRLGRKVTELAAQLDLPDILELLLGLGARMGNTRYVAEKAESHRVPWYLDGKGNWL